MITHKTFLLAIGFVAEDARRAEKYLSDNRLSLIEKKILEAALNLRLKKNREIIESLSVLFPEGPLLKAMKLIVVGTAYNNIGIFNQSVTCLIEASELLKETEYVDQKFLVHRNLFHIYCNLNNLDGITRSFSELKQCIRNPRFDDSFLLCELSFQIRMNQVSEAEATVVQAEKRYGSFNELAAVYFLQMKIDLSALKDDFQGCRENLLLMKSHRNYSSSTNYRCLKAIVDNLLENTPIYVYDWDYDTENSVYWQLKVLALLESGSKEEAAIFWSKLVVNSPTSYQNDFEFIGNKCLFSICLTKHLKSSTLPIELPAGMSKSEKLLCALKESDSPIRKELIYELVYGECLESKDDLKKLSKLVADVKKNHQVEIKSIKGCYQLVLTSDQKKKAS